MAFFDIEQRNKKLDKAVKKMAKKCKCRPDIIAKDHRWAYRQWGEWRVIETGWKYKVKKLVIEPGKSISLQSHDHRDEFWVIIEGRGQVQIDDRGWAIGPGSTLFIRKGAKHKVTCTGDEQLVAIEVQYGEITSEDDITRYE